ncbi:MAG: GTPase domain-containing protein [Mogibacterium sp.]|nr:GTPase domain-containing protein [Mogibacterium sp.]
MAEKKKESRTRKRQKQQSAKFKRILDDNKINVLLLGTSGSGKSTLINAFLDTSKEEASTGTGQAATHSIEVYGDLSGLDYRLIDTPGFEYSHKRQSEITKELKKWLKGSVKNPDPRTVIHTIWFCVDGQQKRLTKDTIDYIRTVSKFWKGIPIIFVSTKSNFHDDIAENSKMIEHELENYEKKDELNIKAVVHVLAKEKGEEKPFGLDELIEATHKLGPEARALFEKNFRAKNLSNKRLSAQKIIAASSATAAAADAAKKSNVGGIITGIQTSMLYEIANVYEVNDGNVVKEIVSAIMSANLVTKAGRLIAGAAVPVAGKKFKIAKKVVTASVSGGVTILVGELGILVFENVYTGVVDLGDINWPKYIDKLLKDKKLSKRVTNIIDAVKKKDTDAAITEINSVIEKIAK